MKTNYFSTKSLSVFSLIGLVGLLVTSCGSYQNSSYYDRDGIYTSSVRNNEAQATAVSNQQYKDYFDSRIEDDSTQVFTDIDGYSSYQNEGDYATGYSAWGSNSDNVTVNVYDNSWGWNNWGWGWGSPYYGWGWNNWYGPSWGFGWGGWYGAGWYGGGWGWNNWYGYPNHGWGWNNHYYYNNYAQSRGRRGESYNYNNGIRNYLSRSNNASARGTRNYNNSSSVRRNMNGTSTRNANFSTRNTIRNTNFNTTRNTSTRNSNAIPVRNNNSNAVPTRNNNSNVAPSRNSTPTRSYSPAPTRSSGSSMGGGRSGGSSGGGGGRSSGGRR